MRIDVSQETPCYTGRYSSSNGRSGLVLVIIRVGPRRWGIQAESAENCHFILAFRGIEVFKVSIRICPADRDDRVVSGGEHLSVVGPVIRRRCKEKNGIFALVYGFPNGVTDARLLVRKAERHGNDVGLPVSTCPRNRLNKSAGWYVSIPRKYTPWQFSRWNPGAGWDFRQYVLHIYRLRGRTSRQETPNECHAHEDL